MTESDHSGADAPRIGDMPWVTMRAANGFWKNSFECADFGPGVPQRPALLVRRPRARSALAQRSRSLSGVDIGNHAAADSRGGRHRALPQFLVAISRSAEISGSTPKFCARRVERLGI